MAPQEGLSPTDSVLRKASIITYPFAFGLSIAHAAVEVKIFPAISLLPMTFSTIFSISLVYIDVLRKAHACSSVTAADPFHKPNQNKHRAAAIFGGDLLFGSGLLICMILTWIFFPEKRGWTCDQRAIMLGTYATVPYMINMCIHIFFVFRAIYTLFPGFGSPTCPHCHHSLSTANPPTRWHGDKKAGYSFLNADETASLYRDVEAQSARPSMEGQETGVTNDAGETAREITSEEVRRVVDV